MKQSFEKMLFENDILPYKGKWKHIKLNHTSYQGEKYIGNKCSSIIPSSVKGVYIYTCPKGKVLYVGQGTIIKRFKRHYKKLEKPKNSRHAFFNGLRIEMDVYYLELPNSSEYERLVIESMLTVILNPIYVQMKARKALYLGCNIDLDIWNN